MDSHLDKREDRSGVKDVRRVVSVTQHAKPDSLVHEVRVGVCRLDDIAWGSGDAGRISLVGVKCPEQLPAQLKLEGELVDDATLDELVLEVLVGRAEKKRAILRLVGASRP